MMRAAPKHKLDESIKSMHGPLESVGFMLSRLGLTCSARFAQALAELQLDPRQFHMLMLIEAREGQSQQQLAEEIRVPKSRMVSMVDDLERRGFVERRRNANDRRLHALYLTASGKRTTAAGFDVARRHEQAICKGLSPKERKQLLVLLNKLVDSDDAETPKHVHPGLTSD